MTKQKIDHILLEKVRIALLSYTSEELFDDIQISTHEGWEWGEIVVRALKIMMVHKISNSRVSHPKNWKEAFKERWFPEWLLKKYPIKYTEYDAFVIFPDFLKYQKADTGSVYLHYDKPGSILDKVEEGSIADLHRKIVALEYENYMLKNTILDYQHGKQKNGGKDG